MNQLPNPWHQPTVSIVEGGALVGMGKQAAYEKAASGELPTVPVGSTRRRVPTAALYQLLGLPLPERPAEGVFSSSSTHTQLDPCAPSSDLLEQSANHT